MRSSKFPQKSLWSMRNGRSSLLVFLYLLAMWAHPPKLDKDIAALIPKSAAIYDRLLSNIQQFNMDTLGPLLKVLQQVRKGKCTAKELIAPLETAIKLSGNAAAYLLME